MEMEYLNGKRMTKLYHEMSPLEAAIQRHEDQVKKYYSLKNESLSMPKAEREQKLKEALDYLKHERMHLEAIAVVQSDLTEYRKAGNEAVLGNDSQRSAALTVMSSEKHHPTVVLERFMRAEGVPKPSRHHTAHHVLPGSGQYNKRAISRARVHVHIRGIRINDPVNGVYLVSKDKLTPHWSMPGSRGHLKYHTSDYELYVSNKVRGVQGVDQITTTLQVIGRLLQQHEPKDAIAKIGQM